MDIKDENDFLLFETKLLEKIRCILKSKSCIDLKLIKSTGFTDLYFNSETVIDSNLFYIRFERLSGGRVFVTFKDKTHLFKQEYFEIDFSESYKLYIKALGSIIYDNIQSICTEMKS